MPRTLWLWPLLVCLGVPWAQGVTARRSVVTGQADSRSCAAPQPQAGFYTNSDKVFLWFEVAGVKAGDELQVDWVNPQGVVSTSMPVTFAQAAVATCVVSPMQIAGYAPAFQPGAWTVRVMNGDVLLTTQAFRVVGMATGSLSVTGISRSQVPVGEAELTLKGGGFHSGSQVQIVRLSGSRFQTVGSLPARQVTAKELTFRYKFADPAEYSLFVQNPDGQTSQPQPITVGYGGFKLPFTAGQVWELTQGNRGHFSHHGNTSYAYDIAPRSGRCVVAMKGGIAYTHDAGMRQDTRSHTFGNYITIDHGNGEYSHYAHLQSGTFAVANGQEVEAGQALATAGSSGYSFGTHVHVQVTRERNISAPSVPFLLEDVPPGRAGAKGVIVSANQSVFCDCRYRSRSQRWVEANGISQTQWWHVPLAVPDRASVLRVTLAWQGAADLDLHLYSPSGKHYEKATFAKEAAMTERMQLPQPEPGTWRLSVNAKATPAGPAAFQVLTTSWY